MKITQLSAVLGAKWKAIDEEEKKEMERPGGQTKGGVQDRVGAVPADRGVPSIREVDGGVQGGVRETANGGGRQVRQEDAGGDGEREEVLFFQVKGEGQRE